MILTKDEILKAIDDGEIKITPYNSEHVGSARYYKPGLSVLPVLETTNYKDISEKVILKDGEHYLLLPGQACLGITEERVTLSSNLCGLLEGRSRFARLGLFVHITAGFMNPGIDNKQVLEIYNASNHPLALYPGVKVCQFIFMRTIGSAKYQGMFNAQEL